MMSIWVNQVARSDAAKQPAAPLTNTLCLIEAGGEMKQFTKDEAIKFSESEQWKEMSLEERAKFQVCQRAVTYDHPR